MNKEAQNWLGTLLLVASAVAYSSAGFYTRLIEVDVWTMLFWRGVFGGLFLVGMIVWRERRRTLAAVRAIGGTGLVVAACSAIATVCFINAMRLGSVADVLVIDAMIPFLTAGIAWLLIGEREDRITLCATLIALAGVVVMARPAVTQGRIAGDLLALAMAVLMSTAMVLIRGKREVSMLPAVGLSAFLCALIVAPFAHPFDIGASDLALLGLFGMSQFGLGLLLLALGTPLVSATRGALLGVLQTPLGTLWVWLAFAEAPASATLLGGMIVLVAVVGDVMLPRQRCVAQSDYRGAS
jgi:drug/metabolite transporter (DMT)-like permease